MSETSVSGSIESSRAVRDTMLMAMSSGASFVLSLARTKLLAVAWGPAGIGAIGMMQAVLSTATVVGGAGVDGVLTRELAKAHLGEPRRAGLLLSAASRGVLVLGAVSAAAAFVATVAFSEQLGFGSYWVAAILGLGVLSSIITANLRAALSAVGLLRIVALLGGAAGLLALVLSGLLVLAGDQELFWISAVVAVPVAQLVVTLFGFRRVPLWPRSSFQEAVAEVTALIRLSKFLAVAGILPPVAQLLLRGLVRDQLDPVAFGCFQGSMALAATSVSVLASSVGPSVLPRLSASSNDPVAMSAVVNEQTTIYLTLFAPVAVGLVALPELVVRLLFSSEFSPVASQLSWQMVGEVMRLPCWVLATALTARSRTRAYLLVEAVSLASLVLAGALSARTERLELIGIGLSLATVLQFVLLISLLRADGVRLSSAVMRRMGLLLLVVVMGAVWARELPVVRLAMVLAAVVAAAGAVRVVLRIRSGGANS